MGFKLGFSDVYAQVRNKRGVTICRIAGTGPCTVDSDCCSNVCVNNVCCLHNETCKMTEVSIAINTERTVVGTISEVSDHFIFRNYILFDFSVSSR